MTSPHSPLGPVLRQAAADADQIAMRLAAVLPRLHAAQAQAGKLIAGTAGGEDKTMTSRLTEAAALTGRTAAQLRTAADMARRLGG